MSSFSPDEQATGSADPIEASYRIKTQLSGCIGSQRHGDHRPVGSLQPSSLIIVLTDKEVLKSFNIHCPLPQARLFRPEGEYPTFGEHEEPHKVSFPVSITMTKITYHLYPVVGESFASADTLFLEFSRLPTKLR